MPVAHAEIDGQWHTRVSEPRMQACGLFDRVRGERRDAVKQLVVMRDLLDALGCGRPSAQHVREERSDVAEALRSAERDQENGVEGTASAFEFTHLVQAWGMARPVYFFTPRTR